MIHPPQDTGFTTTTQGSITKCLHGSAWLRGALAAWLSVLCFSLSASEDGLQPADEAPLDTPDVVQTTPQQTIPDIPVAPNVDLKAPAPAIVETPNPIAEPQAEDPNKAVAEVEPTPTGRSIVVLDTEIPPATSTRLSWGAQESFDGIAAATPVLVVNGAEPGPIMCVTAAVHGDELNGIEMVRSLLYNIDPNRLKGTLIGVPIVNLDGFRRNSRYLTDRRDLNRFFPGNPNGSAASRIAYSFFNEVILHCEVLVDLHTGSFHRSNLPQLRADLKDEDVRALAEGFGGMVVLHSKGAKGTLRRAATRRGIPTVTLEAGEPLRLQKKAVNRGVKGLRSLLSHMEMYGKRSLKIAREPHYYKSQWVRADQGGVLFAEVSLGERVKEGELLGTVTDPITNVRSEMLAPANGRILGMALNQVLMPGFATFRIGIETSEQEILTTQAPAAPIIVPLEQPAEVVDIADAQPDESTHATAVAENALPAEQTIAETAEESSITQESIEEPFADDLLADDVLDEEMIAQDSDSEESINPENEAQPGIALDGSIVDDAEAAEKIALNEAAPTADAHSEEGKTTVAESSVAENNVAEVDAVAEVTDAVAAAEEEAVETEEAIALTPTAADDANPAEAENPEELEEDPDYPVAEE